LRGHTITIDSPTRALPAGWYTDPGQSGGKRWWDGTKWTAHLKMPEVPQNKAAAANANPYGITAVHQTSYVPMNGANVVESPVEHEVYPVSNSAARLSVFFGFAAIAMTLIAALPGSPTLWVCGASVIAVLWGARAILHLIQRRATNLWAPVLGILLGLSAAAVTLLGVNVIGIVNSATGGLIPTASTTVAVDMTPQLSPEPFVFAGNQILTSDGTTVQQVATALNRAYASGNSTLDAGQTWPASLTLKNGQVTEPSGTPLVTIAPGYSVTYRLSADQSSYSIGVTSGNGTEIAIYYSATNNFRFTCPPTDNNCVPVR
jgi:hypothetical protein